MYIEEIYSDVSIDLRCQIICSNKLSILNYTFIVTASLMPDCPLQQFSSLESLYRLVSGSCNLLEESDFTSYITEEEGGRHEEGGAGPGLEDDPHPNTFSHSFAFLIPKM